MYSDTRSSNIYPKPFTFVILRIHVIAEKTGGATLKNKTSNSICILGRRLTLIV